MAGPNVDDGAGATFLFSTSSYTTEVVSINIAGRERASIDTTHLASTAKTYIRGDLVEGGTVELAINYGPDNQPPIYGTTSQETFQLQYPKWGTQTTGATDTFTGFIRGVEGPEITFDQKMDATITIKVSGLITQADGL